MMIELAAAAMMLANMDPEGVVATAPRGDQAVPSATAAMLAASTTDVSPSYVEYQDLPGRIYLANTVDRSRVLKYYVPFVLSGGAHNVYAVPGSGPFAVNTMGGTPPVEIPLPPFDMTVVARCSDNPAEIIPDIPFLYDFEPGHTVSHYRRSEFRVRPVRRFIY